MKKQNLPLFALALIALTIVFVACKKQDNSSTQCQITKVSVNDATISEMNLYYDNNKRLSAITSTSFKKSFTYDGNMMFKSIVDGNGTIVELDTTVLTSSGFMKSNVKYDLIHNDFVYDTMAYDSQDELLKQVEAFTGNQSSADFRWSNGDISGYTSGPYWESYDFYTDKNAIDGDYFWMVNTLFEGVKIFKCKHLCKTALGDTYSYTFDSDGKIHTVSRGNFLLYTYTYTCN